MICSVAKLLDDTPESRYWLGFAYADGYFRINTRRGSLSFDLSLKDIDHANLLSTFLGVDYKIYYPPSKKSPYISIVAHDKKSIELIVDKYDINVRKSYNPPQSTDWIDDDDLFISFLCGFIDGDGSIEAKRGGSRIKIECHKSWLDILLALRNRIYRMFNCEHLIPSDKNEIKSIVRISDHYVLACLKSRAIQLGIPLMTRKWDLVDHLRLTKYESSAIIRGAVSYLLSIGLRRSDIGFLLNISEDKVKNLRSSRSSARERYSQ